VILTFPVNIISFGAIKPVAQDQLHCRAREKEFALLSTALLTARPLSTTSAISLPTFSLKIYLLLSLATQPSLGLGLLLKIGLNFLEASQQFSFLQGRVVSPTLKPHPGGPGLCIHIPQREGRYPF
jgi:hypothetical protein